MVYALPCCFFSLIDVGAMDGLTLCICVCAAYRVVEEENAVCSRNMIQDQLLNFWIVDLLDLVLGAEICDFAGDGRGGGEAVGVEFKG